MSYCAGPVSGDEDVGGLVGQNRSGGFWNGSTDVSFWDTETSGKQQSDGGTGLSAAEMQTSATFLNAGWDFINETDNGTEDIWWIDEGLDYPRLWWETGP